jgi:hypothetical protein
VNGRRAKLPAGGYRSPQRLLSDEKAGTLTVRVFAETGGEVYDFGFGDWPVAAELRIWFARMFLAATGPAGTKRRMGSAASAYGHLRRFARYLGGLSHPPQTPADLKPVHLDGYELARRGEKSWAREIGSLRTMLRNGETTPVEFLRHLETWWTPSGKRQGKPGYSTAEVEQYLAAARAEVRQVVRRIRENRQFLASWRDGLVDRDDRQQWERGWLLDHIDRNGDVPRYGGHQGAKEIVLRQGGSTAMMARLFPTVPETGAFAVLLLGVTGQNISTLGAATVGHHRSDGHTGRTATMITDLVKYRRGPTRAIMSVPLADLPTWIPAPAEERGGPKRQGELHTPFGVFMLLVETMAGARGHAGTDRLFACWSPKRGKGFRAGLSGYAPTAWAESRGFGGFDSVKMRAAWVEIHQLPVAHTEATLVNEYLARHGGDLAAYRNVVAGVLEAEVSKARTLQGIKVLSEADLAEAATAPETVAKRYALDVTTLKRVLAGELETVLAACTDNLASPFSRPGQPCQASFIMCLSCPCARVTPAHLPILIGTYDALLVRKADMTPLRWAERFAGPAAQLQDVLGHFPAQTIDRHRAAITAGQRDLVTRFLNRELDLR